MEIGGAGTLMAPELDPMFWTPSREGTSSDWWGHVPFAHWLVAATRPGVVVEFGTNNGVSFAAFCEAMRRRNIAGRCYTVNAWDGDYHTGNDERAFLDLSAFSLTRYGELSKLMRMTFDDALPHFANGSIDLLHFDGIRRYQTLKKDFDAWLPKLSDRAVALFHDINVSEFAVGVPKFWAELRKDYPSFELPHCLGLGMAAIGRNAPEPVLQLCTVDSGAASVLRERFALLGERLQAADLSDRRVRDAVETERRRVTMSVRAGQVALSERAEYLGGQLRRERAWNLATSERLNAMLSSRSWRAAKAMDAVARRGRAAIGRITGGFSPGGDLDSSDVTLIANSGLFDADFYAGTNEARAMGLSPIAHYIRKGEFAGLSPSPLFDPVHYRETYPDLRNASGVMLIHYIRSGRQEGRQAQPPFRDQDFRTVRFLADRETVVVAIHEATRTGAPILGWNIIGELQKRYNVIALLKKGGPIEQAIVEISSAAVVLPEDFTTRPVEIDALAEKIARLCAPKYLIANSIETRYFVPSFERAGIPTIALVVEFCGNVKPLGALYALFESASQIVFEAQIVADSGLQDYRILEARPYKVLPQGASRLPPNNRAAGPQKAAAKDDFSALPADDGSILVIGMGTIAQRKGVEFFIAAAASVRRQKPLLRIKFAWVGKVYWVEQDYLDYLNEQMKRSNVGASFIFLGEFEDLAPIYARADICLLSSRLDALPNIAIDSAIHGIPIICFDQASGMADLLKATSETKDLVVPYLDAEAAARLVIEMAESPARLSAFSQGVRNIARRHFDMVRYVERLDALGRGEVQAREQAKRDFYLIARSGAFNPQLYLGTAELTMFADDALRKYLRGSHLVAPRGRPWTHLLMRRPVEGFHPMVYASDNPDYDEASGEDPLAHYISNGFPAGRWKHDVIRPNPDAPAKDDALRVAVHGHFHYPELLDDFIKRLRLNRTPCDLLLTTTSEDRAETIRQTLESLSVERATVTVSANRGRDIGPLLTGFNQQTLAAYDVIGHFHSKRSAYMEASVGEVWRSFLWEHLVGGKHAMMDVVMAAFAADGNLGLVFPEDPHLNDWNEDRAIADDLAARMGLALPLPNHFDFPNGTMFWARPQALKPLMDLGITWSDYPEEPVPMDGTLLHALERMLTFSALHAGYHYAATYVMDSVR